jgi:hypothetical protein
MKKNIILAFIFSIFSIIPILSQQNLLPISSYYKDKLFSPFNNKSFSNGSFLPACENDIKLIDKIADSAKQYYQITAFLMKKHLIEIKEKDYYLTISPTLDISRGIDKNDSLAPKLYQNTRGFYMEGDIFKNFSFSSSFYENQARFTKYETAYYQSVGEFYPNGTSYTSQNAVIPGGARTKPFKIYGFDYAYAIGNFVYAPSKRIQISGGNNAHFIGSGYRSLLLSDNSINSPYIQTNIKLTPKLSFVYMRSKLTNLLRRPIKTTDEAYYETKGLSINYLTYKHSDKLSFSLFEGVIWNKGDSISSKNVNPLFYNPIPGLSSVFASNKNDFNSLLGLNTEYLIGSKHRIYNQLAMSNFDVKNIGFQLGYRGYNLGNLKNFMLQLEYNYVPRLLYEAENRRLNYSQYNLPLAISRGNGFQEFVIRSNYEYQYFYIDVKVNLYQLEGFQKNSLLAVNKNFIRLHGNVQQEQIEIGFRLNRKMNITVFGTYIYRQESAKDTYVTKFFNLGIRTGLINHYNDF